MGRVGDKLNQWKGQAVGKIKGAGQNLQQRVTADDWWSGSKGLIEGVGNTFHEPFFEGGIGNASEKISDLTSEIRTSVRNVSDQTKKKFAKDTKGVLRHIPGTVALAPTEAVNIVGQTVSKGVDLMYDGMKYGVGRRMVDAANFVGKIPLIGWIPKYGLHTMNFMIYAPSKIIKSTKDLVGKVLGWPRDKLRDLTSASGSSSAESAPDNVAPFPQQQQAAPPPQTDRMRRAA